MNAMLLYICWMCQQESLLTSFHINLKGDHLSMLCSQHVSSVHKWPMKPVIAGLSTVYPVAVVCHHTWGIHTSDHGLFFFFSVGLVKFL